MKTFAVLLVLSACLCADAQSLRSQILASNRTAAKLMRAKDVKGLTRVWKSEMTPDFKYIEAGKTQDFAHMAAGMEMGLGGMKTLTKVESKLLTLKDKGSTATATTRHTMEGTTVNGGKTHVVAFTGISAETYVKQGGKWKMSQMKWLEQTTKMDGKPVPGMG